MRRALVLAFLAALAVAPPAAGEDVLVFTRTEGYRHESIPDGVAMIRALGAEHGFAVTDTDDASVFTADALAPFEAVVFLSTNREVLDDAQQEALAGFVRDGGGWAGIHAAADTEYAWPFYGEVLLGGAWFSSHPPIQPAAVEVEDAAHPSTRGLPARWTRSDEWYAFTANPRARARVLLRVDESSYDAGSSSMAPDHPIAWCRDVARGRSWYTAMGHTRESYGEADFREHVLGGVLYAAGRLPADCSPRARDAPQVDAPLSIARRELRRRGLPVTVKCPRACTARLRLVAGAGPSPTRGPALANARRVRVAAGASRTLRIRASRRPPAKVRLVASVRAAGEEETVVRIVAVE
ncbi:MAG TPA: ThuA domain-containing protein [Solirubrobacteraceae bacterium]|jgi:type 1 glutamine amidotransferase